MIQNILDRVPVEVLENGAIKYGIYDASGNLIRYEYIKREDEPTEEGTPVNRALFQNLHGDLYTQDRYNVPVVSYHTQGNIERIEGDIIPKTWTTVTIGTSYISENGIKLTASNYYSEAVGGGYAEKACDGNLSEGHYANLGQDLILTLEFPEAIKITKMKIYPDLSAILVSNDGTSFETLDYSSSTITDGYEITFNTPDYYKFYRLTRYNSNNLYRMSIKEWQVSEYYDVVDTSYYKNSLSLPLTSYEKNKIVNIAGSRFLESQIYTTDIVPKLWTEVINGTSYIAKDGTKLTASSADRGDQDFAYFACDGNMGTTWESASSTFTSWIKLEFPEAVKITKMKTRVSASSTSYFSNAKIQGSNNNSTWTDLYTISAYQSSLTQFTLNSPNFYKYYRIHVTLTDASRRAQVYEWQVAEWESEYKIYFTNPYLNINGLGDKLINGEIEYGQKYSLVYNGTSWDICPASITLDEKLTAIENAIVALGGTI